MFKYFFHKSDWAIFPKIGLLWESGLSNILTDATEDSIKTERYFARSMALNVNYCFRKKIDGTAE